ncbi:MAG: prolyl oligopeptidase family serine peptidase [Candidatus Eisenbacteria bacterium]
MQKTTTFIILLTVSAFLAQGVLAQAPPETRVDNVTEEIHGVEIVDPYRWLEDQNSAETRAWIEAQNAYTQSFLSSLPGRETIRQELTDLIRIDTVDIPIARNGRYFFVRRLADQDLGVIYMRGGIAGEDVVLVDPHPMSPEHMLSVTLMSVSDDGSLMAYGIREAGEDELAVRIFDVDRRVDTGEYLPKGRNSDVSIQPDNGGFYYTRYEGESDLVYHHRMGTDPAEDALIFGEGYGPGVGVAAELSDDGRYLLLTVYYGSAARKTELYYQDLTTLGDIVPIVNDIEASFTGSIAGGHLYMDTDWEAPNGRIIRVDLADPARDTWEEIIPETEAVLRGFTLAGGRLIVRYHENVIPTLRVFESDGTPVTVIDPPAIGYLSRAEGRWQDDEAFFEFSSFHIPTTIYRYDLANLTQDVWAAIDVPIDAEMFEVKQVWYESLDGTEVPMFVAHRKDILLDGSNPTLLTGYGGFRSSMTPYFSSRSATWMKMGGVVAVPNLRGGGEFGETWHRAGMLEHKQNTFDDFTAAAEWLIENDYTSPDRLACMGGSNGGLLVGAALTQRPELFRAVVCTYPLLDMVRYHKFLIAKFWVPEYGSSDDPEQFEYIYDYSPYHQVEYGTEYPAVLFVTGDADTRVDPLHARKMTALVQSATGSDKPVLLHYDTTAGHSGGRPITVVIEDVTDQLLFLAWQLGVDL